LPYKNYFSLGPLGNRRCGKRRAAIQTFSRELREKFLPKIKFRVWPSILQGDCIRVIEDSEKEG
jgi:hypothetical protein